MSNKTSVPDAWDDDWVNVVDVREYKASKYQKHIREQNQLTRLQKKVEPKEVRIEPAAKLTKAERRTQHREQQKELWDAAENPGRKLWLEAQGVDVPFEQPYVQPVQLLSRKPPPTLANRDATNGIGKLSLEDDEDSEDERRRKQEADLEERQRKAKLDREEKLRRYAEARERIMGSPKSSQSPNSRDSSHGRDGRRTRGPRNNNSSSNGNNSRRSQPDSPAEPSSAPQLTSDRMLFDPEDMGRRLTPRRDLNSTPKPDEPVRQPRGPTNSGRGGFGFAAKGNSTVA